MKQKLLNSFRLRAVMLVAMLCAAVTGAWATDFTLSSADAVTKDGITISFDKGSGSSAPTWYAAGLRLYAKNTITISSNNTITGITLNWEKQGNKAFATATASVGNYNHPTSTGAGTWTGSANSITFTLGDSGQLQLNTLSVTVSGGGSVTPTCATPNFSPAAGAVVSGTTVTISSTEGATIYYTTNGSNPTTSSSVYSSPIEITEATTIKAFATKSNYIDSEVATAAYTIKPVVSGYTVDFESDLEDYVDWTFTNIGTSNNAITAHGGNKYGANINASGNGVATCSIQTNETIALPGTFTCYVSKASGNTTASTWTLAVSENGTDWTTVATQAAQSMSSGTWDEFTANLGGYSDVYVRLSYGSSSAIRAIDDISITMRDPNAKITPTVTIDATGLTNDLANSTNVNAGTIAATVSSGETTITSPAVTWSSSDTDVATVDASTGAVTLIAVGTTTITASFAGNDDYTDASASYELTVVDSYAKGQVNNPYTVAEAIENAPSSGTSDNVYIRGIVSAFYNNNTSIMDDGNNYRYYISDEGTETNQLVVYKGKKSSTEAFSSADDLSIGDIVTIYGGLNTYNNAAQVASGNYIVSRTTKTTSDLAKTNDISLSMTNPSVTATATDYFTTSSTGAISYEIANEAVATVSVAGVVTPVAAGTTTLTVSQAADATYKAGSLEITVTVAAASLNSTTIVANASGSTTYGTNKEEDYMIDDTYDGTVTAVSGNPAVATVAITQHTAGEGTFTITPVAVGTAVITISAPATATCEAADDVTYTITVTAPVGGTTAAPASVDPVTIDFTSNAFSLPTSSSEATTGDITDGTYTLNVSGGNGAYYYSDGDALLMGKSGATLALPTFNNVITKIAVTGSSKAGTSVKQNIFVGETAVSTATTGAKDVINEYEIDPDYQTAGTQYLLKVTSSHNTQISSIKINFASTDLSVKLNTSGYATYCSQYPLDFSAATDYSAWQITGVSGETITFSQITGSVKGGTGILLKGTASETVTLTSADSNNELSGNKLFGTLAPTYVAADQYYGLSGENFVKVNAGTVKAGKALLPASVVDGTNAKAFTFVFEGADGIKTVEHVTAEEAAEIFNLAGQRLQKAQRGVNIINGKKVLVK